MGHFQFEDKWGNWNVKTIKLDKPKLSNDTNHYIIKPFEKYENGSTFGINISFERNMNGTNGILINYHFMSAILVLIASINFVIDPTIVPGRAGLLVTLFLVLTNFFSDAQVLFYHLPNLPNYLILYNGYIG